MSQSINLPLPERLGFALLWFVLVSLPVFQQDFSVRYEFLPRDASAERGDAIVSRPSVHDV